MQLCDTCHAGEQGWNDDADGHMSGEGQSHLDHGDLNNSARGRQILVDLHYLFSFVSSFVLFGFFLSLTPKRKRKECQHTSGIFLVFACVLLGLDKNFFFLSRRARTFRHIG